MNRRDMLRYSGVAVLGAALPSPACAARSGRRLERIGVQLYTVRREMGRDVAGTLARVAEIGYREVEFAGYFGQPPAAVKAALASAGLDAPAAHVPFEAVRNGWDQLLETAAAIGHRHVLVAWIPSEARATLDDWRRAAELFNRAGERARAAGLAFAYHNHDFEFVPVEGSVPFDLLLSATDPALVSFELDLYWITKAGRDPLDYFTRHPGRFRFVHVKDSAGPPEHRMMDVGSGRIDFKAIFARSEQAGIRHYFVEHDEPADPLASCRQSFAYLSRLEF